MRLDVDGEGWFIQFSNSWFETLASYGSCENEMALPFIIRFMMNSISLFELFLMPNYRRLKIAGSTYFITQLTYQRKTWLCHEIARHGIRTAITQVRKRYPFTINAFILLPTHFHYLLTLPKEDGDLSTRIRLIKTYLIRNCRSKLNLNFDLSESRKKRK